MPDAYRFIPQGTRMVRTPSHLAESTLDHFAIVCRPWNDRDAVLGIQLKLRDALFAADANDV